MRKTAGMRERKGAGEGGCHLNVRGRAHWSGHRVTRRSSLREGHFMLRKVRRSEGCMCGVFEAGQRE